MKNFRLQAIYQMALLLGLVRFGQQTPAATAVAPVSNYNYHDAFAPFFYTKNGTSTRSASGQPGAEYWQNRADYVLTAKLNEAKMKLLGLTLSLTRIIVQITCLLCG
jgi:hypothetical protein